MSAELSIEMTEHLEYFLPIQSVQKNNNQFKITLSLQMIYVFFIVINPLSKDIDSDLLLVREWW